MAMPVTNEDLQRTVRSQQIWEVMQSSMLRSELGAKLLISQVEDWAKPESVVAVMEHCVEMHQQLLTLMGAMGEFAVMSVDFNLDRALKQARDSVLQ